MDLRDAAQELYAVTPRDFTAHRTALARKAKDAGSKELAQEIGGLAKPAAGAWAINMLALHKPEVIDGVVRFGISLRNAQEAGDPETFRELGQQRQGQLTAAVHAAKDLATELGVPLSAAAASDVEQTLRAAMADAGAAAAVATGRLVRGLSGSGFEEVDLTDAIAATGPDDQPGRAPAQPAATKDPGSGSKSAPASKNSPSSKNTPSTAKTAKDEATSLADRRAAKQQAALEEARREFESADTTAKEAEVAASVAWETVNELADRRANLKSDIEELKKRLATLEADLIGVTRDAESAESDKKRAVRTATQQRRTADQAQRRVDRLS